MQLVARNREPVARNQETEVRRQEPEITMTTEVTKFTKVGKKSVAQPPSAVTPNGGHNPTLQSLPQPRAAVLPAPGYWLLP